MNKIIKKEGRLSRNNSTYQEFIQKDKKIVSMLKKEEVEAVEATKTTPAIEAQPATYEKFYSVPVNRQFCDPVSFVVGRFYYYRYLRDLYLIARHIVKKSDFVNYYVEKYKVTPKYTYEDITYLIQENFVSQIGDVIALTAKGLSVVVRNEYSPAVSGLDRKVEKAKQLLDASLRGFVPSHSFDDFGFLELNLQEKKYTSRGLYFCSTKRKDNKYLLEVVYLDFSLSGSLFAFDNTITDLLSTFSPRDAVQSRHVLLNALYYTYMPDTINKDVEMARKEFRSPAGGDLFNVLEYGVIKPILML